MNSVNAINGLFICNAKTDAIQHLLMIEMGS